MASAEDFIVSTEYDGQRRKLYAYFCITCGAKGYAPKYVKPTRKFCRIGCYKKSIAPTRHQSKCDFCGTTFLRRPSLLKKSKSGFYFCNRTCKDLGQRLGSNLQRMRLKHYADGRFSYREIAFRNANKICNRCGWNEYVEVLKVHHKDRNRDNNDPSNLEVLCPNCHDIEHFLKRDGVYSDKHKGKKGP